ncbi:hypothetical protein LIER_15930 [Lithospermum erythrorhizon]|uniref:FAR1 domain-containing protein n=1 Tax=Lithospermum erythrorhizon TaxID=34254 RepID=A0AAV3Q667_LITER
MSSENTTPSYENIDLDSMDFDFSFNDAGIFYGETAKRNHVDSEGANRNNQGFDSETSKQNDLKNEATGLRYGGWKCVVVEGRHNHDLPVYAEGHTIGKFQEAEYKLTPELTKSFMAPNDILRTLKRVTKYNSSIIKHVNNARQKLRAEEMEWRRPIQQFQKFLTENGYYQFFPKRRRHKYVK